MLWGWEIGLGLVLVLWGVVSVVKVHSELMSAEGVLSADCGRRTGFRRLMLQANVL